TTVVAVILQQLQWTTQGQRSRTRIATAEIASVLFNHAMQGITMALCDKMPTKDSIRNIVQEIRKENFSAPPIPASQASVVHLNNIKYIKFLVWRRELYFNFRCNSHVNWVNRMQNLYTDVLFSFTPPLFSQIYVIMAK
ncbi:hypothetical protein MXB_4932, partial [Myxobolus squamalis]